MLEGKVCARGSESISVFSFASLFRDEWRDKRTRKREEEEEKRGRWSRAFLDALAGRGGEYGRKGWGTWKRGIWEGDVGGEGVR